MLKNPPLSGFFKFHIAWLEFDYLTQTDKLIIVLKSVCLANFHENYF